MAVENQNTNGAAGSVSAEEESLNAEIRQLEEEIASRYADIGKEYYEENPDSPASDEMAACFREIGERKEKIRDCTDRLRTLKGITTCKACGADVLLTDTFCSTCGARIISEVTVSPAGGICPSCGHRVNPDQMFCSTCGAKLNLSEEIDPGDGFPDDTFNEPLGDAVPEAGAEGEKLFCINCGSPLEPGDLFCINCGQKVEK